MRNTSMFVNEHQIHKWSILSFTYLARENIFLMASVMRYNDETRQEGLPNIPEYFNESYVTLQVRHGVIPVCGTCERERVLSVWSFTFSMVPKSSLYQLRHKNTD